MLPSSPDPTDPDPYAHDPLSRPGVPPADAQDPHAWAHRRDMLEAARADARRWRRRAIIGTVVVPGTVVMEASRLGALAPGALDWLLRIAVVVCGVLWFRAIRAARHENACHGMIMHAGGDTGGSDGDPP